MRYRKRVSGPLVDRLNIFVDVPRLDYDKLTGDGHGETSSELRALATWAATPQQRRLTGSRATCSADIVGEHSWED